MKAIVPIIVSMAVGCFAQVPGALDGISTLRPDVTSARESSWDRAGRNADFISIPAGATAALAEIKGPGEIRHIWVTINSPSPNHLRELVLRMYWDGEDDPSVEVPIGDFFGTGFGYEDVPSGHTGQAYHDWQSLPITVNGKAMNCYFEMPFGKSARVTVTNDGSEAVPNFYYHIDYVKFSDPTATASKGRFHAQWRQELTTPVSANGASPVDLDGRDNYVFMHAKGEGQFIGVILSIQGFSTGWWGEGNDMFFIDGAKLPSIEGTGLEDYFGSGWMFRGEYNYPFTGYSLKGNPDWTGSHVMYRFHITDPIYFHRALIASIEHGHANRRRDLYTSVAYWYQKEPHEKLDPLPALRKRLVKPFWKIETMQMNLPN